MSARSLNWLKFGSLVALAFSLGLFFAGLVDAPTTGVAQQAQARHTNFTAVPAPDIQGIETLVNLSEGFANVAEAVRPSVVVIESQRNVEQANRRPSVNDFFQQNPRDRFQEGHGSGFIVSHDGYILTNNHVIEGADRVIVRLTDRREFVADIIGTDPNTDLAVLKIDADGLTPAALGHSEAARVGEWVLAIGNPMGDPPLTFTVTSGIISAKGRGSLRLPGRTQLSIQDFIQTDAAINPGNSGGPLVNLQGEVIGMNTAINPRANTIGFAVPINMAKDILPQLRASGRVTRGWLGVMINPVRPEFQEHLDVESDKGALVSQVLPDGPAADAGIQEYDIIVEFDGEKVDEMNDLPRIVARTPVEKKVKVVVLRKGKRKTLTARVGAMPVADETEIASIETGESAFGLHVQKVTPDLARQLGVDEAEGVVITSVEPGGPASEAGLRRGDVILELNRESINDEDALREKLDDVTKSALLLIRRGDATLFMALKRDTG